MAFVYLNKACVRDIPACQCLRRRDLNRCRRIGPEIPTLYDANVREPFPLEGRDGLLDEADARDNKDDLASLGERGTADFRGYAGFATARWQLENRAQMSRSN
jgi:hypothetical protein